MEKCKFCHGYCYVEVTVYPDFYYDVSGSTLSEDVECPSCEGLGVVDTQNENFEWDAAAGEWEQ